MFLTPSRAVLTRGGQNQHKYLRPAYDFKQIITLQTHQNILWISLIFLLFENKYYPATPQNPNKKAYNIIGFNSSFLPI